MEIFKKKLKYPSVPVREVQKVIIEKLTISLKSYGFRRKGTTFYRNQGELIQLINLQASPWNQGYEATYYVNLAIYYGPVYEIQYGAPSQCYPKEYEGQLRSRLKGKDVPASWEFSPKVDIVFLASELASAVVKYGVPYFDGINTPLQLAEALLDKNKNDMSMITDHVSRAIFFSLIGDKVKAQTEFDLYFNKNTRLQNNSPTTKTTLRTYLCIAQRTGLSLNIPELNDDICVGIYINMKGKRLLKDERRTFNKLLIYLRNLESKKIGYIHYYDPRRNLGMYRVGFCTPDPDFVVTYLEQRKNKFANPLADIIINDEF